MKYELLPPALNLDEVTNHFSDLGLNKKILLQLAEQAIIKIYWKLPSPIYNPLKPEDLSILDKSGFIQQGSAIFMPLSEMDAGHFLMVNDISIKTPELHLSDDVYATMRFFEQQTAYAESESRKQLLYKSPNIVMKKTELHIFKNDLIQFINTKPSMELDNGEKEPNAKSKSYYLQTILALSEALTGGLKGRPDRDALIIIAALTDKGVAAPIKEDALARYLLEAKKYIKGNIP